MPGPPPVMTAKPRLARAPAQVDGLEVVGIVGLGAGGAEDGDGGGHAGHGFEALDEFGHDAEDSPDILGGGFGLIEHGVLGHELSGEAAG